MAIGILSVHATPLHIHARATDATNAQVAPVIQCLRQKHPQFPKQGQPTDQELRDCVAQSQPKAKRDDTIQSAAINELIYEPTGATNLTTRGVLTDTLQVLGKPLGVQDKATCVPNRGLGNEFAFGYDIQANAKRVCNDLKNSIEKKGLREDGGISYVIDQMGNAHNKKGHQLEDNVKITATYMLTIYPPTGMALKDIQTIASGIYDLCDDAILRLTSRDEGCTEDVKYYRPSKVKHYNDPGVLDGAIGMYFDGGLNTIAQLGLSFTNNQ